VEGSLFVVKRRTQPRFQFVVMNRRSTDNLVEDLLGEFEYEVQVPYLLYRNAAQEVNGIWFYNPRECEEVAKLFQRILSAFSNKPQKANLFSSRSEYQELEPMAAMIEGPLEPSAGAISSVTEGPDEPLERFFSVFLSTFPDFSVD
jgi:mRNA-decapping enzyme 1B